MSAEIFVEFKEIVSIGANEWRLLSQLVNFRILTCCLGYGTYDTCGSLQCSFITSVTVVFRGVNKTQQRKAMEWWFTTIIRGAKHVYQWSKKCQYNKVKLIAFTLIKNQSYFKVVCARAHKNLTMRLSVIYKTFHKNVTVNMHYVNIKIKKKNTIGFAKRFVTLLHCPFPAKVSGREGYGYGTLGWVGCDYDCSLLLFTFDSNLHKL